jgi:SPP1 gp7 family putative phage head morphogenesis protein
VIQLASPPPTGEAFPPELRARKKLYGELRGAIDQSERLIARHFRAFARAMASKTEYLVAISLDEYADNVDNVLGGDLNDLRQALQTAIGSMDRRVLTLGAEHAMSAPALASIDIAWDLQRPDVEQYLSRHALDLVQDLDDTTRTRLATVLRQGVRDGKSIAQITDDVGQAARSMSVQRARMVAQTEILRSFNGGAVSAYQASGIVSGIRFVDGQANACGLCQSMNGKIIAIDGEFSFTLGNKTASAPYPPIHPSCRCSTAPVIEGV